MLRFILTKLALLIPTFVGVTLLTFFMIRLIPGDPIELLVGERHIDSSNHRVGAVDALVRLFDEQIHDETYDGCRKRARQLRRGCVQLQLDGLD